MDYEKKYNEALKRAKAVMDIAANQDEARGIATTIFPELRESEDERIRQGIVETIKQCTDMLDPKNQKRMLDWLEKQKEQKPSEPKNWPADKDTLTQEQKPAEPSDDELVRHSPISYTYPSDASRDERLKAALLALLNSDLLQVKEGGYFTKQDLIDWVEKQKPAENGVDVIKTSALLAADRLASAEMTGRFKERSEILENPEK